MPLFSTPDTMPGLHDCSPVSGRTALKGEAGIAERTYSPLCRTPYGIRERQTSLRHNRTDCSTISRQRNRRTMAQRKYIAKNSDEDAQERIEGIKVFCPHCGEEANLIWSVANGYHHASWHCPCQASEKDLWKGWGTTDPEPFREKQQRFKNLFDFSNDE